MSKASIALGNHWWQREKDPNRGVWDTLRRLKTDRQDREEKYLLFLQIFMNAGLDGLWPGDDPAPRERIKTFLKGQPQLVLNAVENCITTLGARIASQRPRASFLTSTDGPEGYKLELRARGLEKFIAGEWYREKIYRKSVKTFKFSAVCGLGATKVLEREGKVHYEVTQPWQIIVDNRAAANGDPRTLFQVKLVPAEILLAQFAGDRYGKKHRETNERSILRNICGSSESNTLSSWKTTVDLVEVCEAWHLPSGYGADDGRHIICLKDRTLTTPEEWSWTSKKFPFAFLPWNEPLVGWYPQGLIAQQRSAQSFVNKLLGRLQDAMHMYSAANTFYEKGSIDKKDMSNTTGKLIPIKPGSKYPETKMPQALSAELIRVVWDIYGKIFEGTGVSQLSAASVKPAGIESGRALRVLQDSETGRHALLAQAWDDYFVDLAEITVEMVAEMGGYKANYINRERNMMETINWSDVDMDRDCYEIQIFPSSMLPHEPAGRLATVEEMLNAGFVNREQALALLDFPDLKQFTSLEIAAQQDIKMQISNMLVDGKEEAPEPYMNLQLGLAMVTSALLRARQQNAPEERQKLLIDWLEAAAELLAPPPPPPMPMDAEMPMGEEVPPLPADGLPSPIGAAPIESIPQGIM